MVVGSGGTKDADAHDFVLSAHPAHPPLAMTTVTARLDLRDPNWLRLRWRIKGAGRLVVPQLSGRKRADGLWRTTCFELFIRPDGGDAYQEWNFSPSEAWAVYSFDGYRAKMTTQDVARPPVITWRGGASGLRLMDAAVPRAALPPLPWRYGMTAVLEEEGGCKSYWAAAHPDDKPDFHNAACFTGRHAAPLDP